MIRKLLMTTLALLFLAPNLLADRRKYVWTYQTVTIPENATELEFYQTTKLDRTDSWEYRIEVEHGLKPGWDLSVYQIFSQTEDSSFKWDAVQIRTRYRLAEPGTMMFNPVLYLEYNRKIDLKAKNKAEAKLLLGHDFDRVNLSLNPVYEFFWAPGDPKHELGLDLGLSYEFSYKFAAGLESTSRVEWEKDKPREKSSYFGPTMSFASGENWYSIGVAWGLNSESNDARIRFLMGIGL